MSNENVSSDLLTSLNSIPNERGFKMAFLNIVTLPSKIDEIRHSMCSKNIDLIAFNALLISRSQIDSKSGVNKKGTERLLFWSKFYSFFYSIFGIIFTP